MIGGNLSRTPLSLEPKLIGIKSQVKHINLWLQDGSSDVGILVLYGMSGIGKTTIAKHVYNSNFRSFEGSSFIENIKARADQPNGLVQIQMQLLYDILIGRKVKIQTVSEGIIKIESTISSKKVLLVLDDVDHVDQLDAVLKMKDRFYPGSKILITTRRERLLRVHQVTKVYKVETLNYNESLELFSWHAFGQDRLIDRCLVTIDKYGKVNMHDMIRDMGREIVRQESEEPEKRSRLWRHKDSFEVLRDKNGTKKIQGIVLNMYMHPAHSPINTNETVLETNAFEKMCKLQLLHLSHVRLDGCYADFPTGLRWLCWLHFPLDFIPIDFPLGCLIVLDMQYSSLRQVWKGTKFLPMLKILDVSHSHALTEIMDFSLCPSLEELILVDCTSLIDVHESIGKLERLVYLNVKDCKNLRMLPKNMCMLKSLETLILSGCSNLDEFPLEMMKKMKSLKVLETDEIPLSELWPERTSSILSSFPCSLVELNLSRCNLSEDVFPTDLSNLSSIQRLYLDENPICSLPVFIKGLRRIDELSFINCKKLESLVGLPRVHKEMVVAHCISLKKVTYQSFVGLQLRALGKDNNNIVEWEYIFKLESIDRVDVEMIKLLGLFNLESMPAIRMKSQLKCFNSKEDRWSPVQGLYQYGIFNTFFVGNEVPGRFSYKSTKSSISFSVPLLPSSHRIRGLNIFATYANEENSNYNYENSNKPPLIIKVSNQSKGLTWIYCPHFHGILEEGEDMIWLSHWKMENETILQCGDQVVVSVIAEPAKLFRIKEFGVELMQEHQNNMMISTQHNTKLDPNYPCVIGGDLSKWEHIPGIYFLGCSKKIC